jgi:hypothetical protein
VDRLQDDERGARADPDRRVAQRQQRADPARSRARPSQWVPQFPDAPRPRAVGDRGQALSLALGGKVRPGKRDRPCPHRCRFAATWDRVHRQGGAGCSSGAEAAGTYRCRRGRTRHFTVPARLHVPSGARGTYRVR